MPYKTKIGYNIRVKKVLKSLLFLVTFLILPTFLHAESGGFSIVSKQSSLVPGENIVLEIVGYSYDINSAEIVWYKNGSKLGYSSKSITVTFPEYGKYDTYKSSINIGNNFFEIYYTLGAESVDLLYEADNSYTIPFYKGRPLPIKQSVIKVSAIPVFLSSGSIQNTSESVYNWKHNKTNQANYSGLGKRFYLFQNSFFYTSENIEVAANKLNSDKVASGFVDIGLQSPEVILFQNNPALGVLFNKNLSSGLFIPKNTEYSVVAYPYRFSVKKPDDSDLNYNWKINNEKINTPEQKNILNIRTGPESGYSVINLNIDSKSKLYQENSKSIYVNY